MKQYFDLSLRWSKENRGSFSSDWFDVEDVLLPIVPILQDTNDGGEVVTASTSSVQATSEETETVTTLTARGSTGECLSQEKLHDVHMAQCLSLQEKLKEADSRFPAATITTTTSNSKVFTKHEWKVIICCAYMMNAFQMYEYSIDYVEGMLTNQLIAAIGKTVTPNDFQEYMKFHHLKVLKEEYRPRNFSYSVRRSNVHSPEGAVRIEMINPPSGTGSNSNSGSNLLMTMCREYVGTGNTNHLMEVAIDASTKIRFGGERYVHGWLGHGFSNDLAMPEIKLVAETRQFSSYIVVLGRVTGPNTLDPQHAFIVQNKDLMTIPLLIESIPTPKQFRDAIASLSPEQQAFAKAYRSMQLASTLFGMAIIQIKPQLEKVLRLEEDSLTKEIKLTQDLMKLFIEYQIPTDLLSYDGAEEGVSSKRKVDRVKELVEAMLDMLKGMKGEEIEEQQQIRAYSGNAMTIFVRLITGKTIALTELYREMTILDLRRKLYEKEGISARLVFAGKQLDSDRSIADYGMYHECTIYMVLRLRGDGGDDFATSSTTSTTLNNNNSNNRNTSTSTSTNDYTNSMKEEVLLDVTKFPVLLDQTFERYDEDNVLRPAILQIGNTWSKVTAKDLLSKPVTLFLNEQQQSRERQAAFGLLDALTKSGGLSIAKASFHVIIATIQRFDQSLLHTIIRKNINPIASAERSYLMIGSVLQEMGIQGMVQDEQKDRVRAEHRLLLTQYAADNEEE
jgi:hypothetical protein